MQFFKIVCVRILVVVFFVSLSLVCHGQTRSHAYNTHAWLMYFGNHKFSGRMGWHAEAQWRRSEVVSANQQLVLRTGLDFYTKSNLRYTLGYAFVQTYPYGEFAVPNAFPEHRIWQQLLVPQELPKIRITHRYRLEQRMIGNASTGEFADGRFENRARYMVKASTNLSNGDRPVFVAFYDEVFVNFGKDVGYNLFDQNRLYGALGFTISPTLKLELGYLYQVVKLRTLDGSFRNRIENNHTLQIGLFSSAPFSK